MKRQPERGPNQSAQIHKEKVEGGNESAHQILQPREWRERVSEQVKKGLLYIEGCHLLQLIGRNSRGCSDVPVIQPSQERNFSMHIKCPYDRMRFFKGKLNKIMLERNLSKINRSMPCLLKQHLNVSQWLWWACYEHEWLYSSDMVISLHQIKCGSGEAPTANGCKYSNYFWNRLVAISLHCQAISGSFLLLSRNLLLGNWDTLSLLIHCF